jgi:hypothetical protein
VQQRDASDENQQGAPHRAVYTSCVERDRCGRHTLLRIIRIARYGAIDVGAEEGQLAARRIDSDAPP